MSAKGSLGSLQEHVALWQLIKSNDKPPNGDYWARSCRILTALSEGQLSPTTRTAQWHAPGREIVGRDNQIEFIAGLSKLVHNRLLHPARAARC